MSVDTEALPEQDQGEQPQKLTRPQAYLYLGNLLDRLDRDVSILTQGASSSGELASLSEARKGLVDVQQRMLEAQHHAVTAANNSAGD